MAKMKIIADKQAPMSPMIRLMCGDARTQIVSIVIPRMFGDVDLCDLAWSIKVVNAKGVTDVCTPYGEVKCTDDEIVVDWLICGVATAVPGTTVFEVVGVDETAEGHPIIWKSGIGNLLVNECLNASPSGEQEEQLSSLDKLIIYVNGELTNVIAAGDAANDAAEKANQASESIAALEGEIKAAENARVEKFAGYEKRIGEAEKLAQESVLYTPQTITEAQQAQARENVGAASAERVEKVADALPGKLSEPAEGLAVGKYFRVAALDENGHAVLEAVDAPKEGLALTPAGWPEWTADEQAAARERMGIPGNYELLEESIFEETVTYMSRNSDGQGNAYCLDAIMIYLETEHDDSNGSGRCAVYTDNGYMCDFYLGNLNNTKGSISTVKVYPLNGCWNSTARNAVNDLQSTTGYANIMNGYIKPIIKSGYIRSFYISGKIVAGSKLMVYGVRA